MFDLSVKVLELIKEGWSKKTCYPPLRNEWTDDKPDIGQCAVTSLVLQRLMFPTATLVKNDEHNHYFLQLRGGGIIDICMNQFGIYGKSLKVDEVIISRNELLNNKDTKKRYNTLLKYVAEGMDNWIYRKDK